MCLDSCCAVCELSESLLGINSLLHHTILCLPVLLLNPRVCFPQLLLACWLPDPGARRFGLQLDTSDSIQ